MVELVREEIILDRRISPVTRESIIEIKRPIEHEILSTLVVCIVSFITGVVSGVFFF